MSGTAPLQLLAGADGRRMRWKNDGGWTTEIARRAASAPDDGDFLWRVSIAEIERDGPFSRFPGITRNLALLEGAGMELTVDDAPPVRLERRFQQLRFAGDARVACRLLEGPTRDLNVMVRADRVQGELWCRPLVDTMVLFPEPGVEWLVHLLAGSARLRWGALALALQVGDSARLQGPGATLERVLIEGGGEVALVKLSEIAPPAAPLRDLR